MTDLSPLEKPDTTVRMIDPRAKGYKTPETHDIRLSMDVSIGVVERDLRKDARPGVKAAEVDGMLM